VSSSPAPAGRAAQLLLALLGSALAAVTLPANAWGGAADGDAGDARFAFAVLGDTPYFAFEEMRLEALIPQIDREPLAFVLHVGDIKSGQDRCSDALYLRRRALFARFTLPFLIIPGDNDWVDCARQSNGAYHPLERLTYFRSVFYAQPGHRAPGFDLERQGAGREHAEQPENMRWTIGKVAFATANVTGSHNGFRQAPAMDGQYAERNAANLEWLLSSFERARAAQAAALVFAIHADPRFEAAPGSLERQGFEDFLRALEQAAKRFARPVLLIHGDSHVFRVDRPLAGAANLVRLETYGAPKVGWVRVTVDAGDPRVFSVEGKR
jgi:hypothetical protein